MELTTPLKVSVSPAFATEMVPAAALDALLSMILRLLDAVAPVYRRVPALPNPFPRMIADPFPKADATPLSAMELILNVPFHMDTAPEKVFRPLKNNFATLLELLAIVESTKGDIVVAP